MLCCRSCGSALDVAAPLRSDVGTSTLPDALHPEKANCSMLVTDEGGVMLVNALHPWKAHAPMLVTDEGKVMLVNELLDINAC